MGAAELTASDSSSTRLLRAGTIDTELAHPSGNSVPNRTQPLETVAPFVDAYTENHKQLGQIKKKDIGIHIDLGQVVHEAHAALSRKDYKLFCNQVHLKGSEERKYKRIGEDAERLRKHIELLPPNHTTIYYVARTGREEFDKLIGSGALCATMTKGRMDACLGRTTTRDTTRKDVILDFGGLDTLERKRAAFQEFKELGEQLGVRVTESKRLARVIADIKPAIAKNERSGRKAA